MPNGGRVYDPFPLVVPGDAGLLATEAVHALLVRAISAKRGDSLADGLASLATRLRPGKRKAYEELYHSMIGAREGLPAPGTYVHDILSTMLQQRMFYARLSANKAWRPHLEIEGADALAEARRKGQGVVLWLLPLEMIAVLVRLACAECGWTLPFMSHYRHGPSTSRLGQVLVNDRDGRTESQFGPRLIMTETDTRTALTEAGHILARGGMIGFRGIGWAKRPVYYPLFDGHMHLAFGAPSTCRRANAALFVAGAARVGTGFRVSFTEFKDPHDREIEALGADFAAALERAAIASPSLWSVKSRQWAPGAPPEDFSPMSHRA